MRSRGRAPVAARHTRRDDRVEEPLREVLVARAEEREGAERRRLHGDPPPREPPQPSVVSAERNVRSSPRAASAGSREANCAAAAGSRFRSACETSAQR